MYLRTNPPPDIAAYHERQVRLVREQFVNRQVKLSETKFKRLEGFVRRRLEDWEANTGALRGKLRELNDFLDGQDQESGDPYYPYVGSIDVRTAIARARTLRANHLRTVFNDPRVIVAVQGPGSNRDQLNELENAINWTAAEESNLFECLKQTPVPTFRDGLSLVHGEWVRDIDHGCEMKVYLDPTQFKADFPDAETAGITEAEYDDAIDRLTPKDGEEPEELTVEFETDFVSKNQPVYTVFPLAKFIWSPILAENIDEMDVYGYRYRQSQSQFKHRIHHEYYLPEAKELLKRSGAATRDQWDAGLDGVEGINSSGAQEASYDLAHLVVRCDLDNSGVPKRYRVQVELESKKILRIENYDIRRNIPCVVEFAYVRRPGRFLADSLLENGLDLYKIINGIHRHRSQVRRLTDTVTLVMPDALKEHEDLAAEYAQFRVGKTIWVPDTLWKEGMTPKQLQIHNLSNSGNSQDEESLAMRYLEFIDGISQGMSGRESASDPRAPASKTAMLLQRGDLRIEDLVEEWGISVPRIIDLHRALFYQNAGGPITYMARVRGNLDEKKVNRALLAEPNAAFALKRTAPNVSPELEMNRIAALLMTAFKFQIPVQMNPEIVVQGWNDFVMASRIDQPERYLIEIQPKGYAMGGDVMPPEQMEGRVQQLLASLQGENGMTTGSRPAALPNKPS